MRLEMMKKVEDGTMTIGELAEFLQDEANKGTYLTLPSFYIQAFYRLAEMGICGHLGVYRNPKLARDIAENPDKYKKKKTSNPNSHDKRIEKFKLSRPEFINNGRLFPPLSIRRIFRRF